MDKKERFRQAYEYAKGKAYFHTQKDLSLLMRSTESNVSRALKGDPVVLTDNFLQRFSAAMSGLFNVAWLLGEDGPMLNEAKAEPTADERILSLAASLIKETEGLRRQLQAELDDIRALKKELRDTILTIRQVTTIQFPGTSANYLAERPSE